MGKTAVVLALLFGTAKAQFYLKHFEPREKIYGTDTLKYRLMSPAKVENNVLYPLVVFYHGAGERGGDNVRQLEIGVHRLAKDDYRAAYPCFVFAPQCPMKNRWVETDFRAPSHEIKPEPNKFFAYSQERINELAAELPIDPERVYVMGLSMGGFATWEALSRFPDKFAAAVPVCGGADLKEVPKFCRVPIRVYHGEKDNIVTVERSRNAVAELTKCGARPLYVEYPGVGHNCWSQCFNDPELYAWLFSHRKN
jgi:predicted peptidase